MKPGFAESDRALFWTFAVAAFAAAAAGLVARAVDRYTTDYEADRMNYAIVRVLAPEGPAGVASAEVALADAPHVSSAAPMTARRAAALLEQWGGAPVSATDMPPLRLIEIELAPVSAQADVEGDLVAALARGGVTAEVVRAPETGGAGAMPGRVRTLTFLGAIACAIVMAMIIALAARGIAARRRDLVHALTDMGATRGQAAGRIADEAARAGFGAGAAGALAAGAIALALLFVLVPGATLETLPGLIAPIDAAPLAIAPFLAAAAAAMGARAGAESFYAQAARVA